MTIFEAWEAKGLVLKQKSSELVCEYLSLRCCTCVQLCADYLKVGLSLPSMPRTALRPNGIKLTSQGNQDSERSSELRRDTQLHEDWSEDLNPGPFDYKLQVFPILCTVSSSRFPVQSSYHTCRKLRRCFPSSQQASSALSTCRDLGLMCEDHIKNKEKVPEGDS